MRIAPLKFFSTLEEVFNDLKENNQPAFEILEDGKVKSFPSLNSFKIFSNPFQKKYPILLFDNHNHSFFFWHFYQQELKLPTPFTLIHIDQHKDTRIPASFITQEESLNEKYLAEYTNHTLNVGNFIPPAVKTNLIKNIINIDSELSLLKIEKTPIPENFILDIDLDFFSDDLNYIDHNLKIRNIQRLIPFAKIITFATSPYFIKSEKAFSYFLKIFTEKHLLKI